MWTSQLWTTVGNIYSYIAFKDNLYTLFYENNNKVAKGALCLCSLAAMLVENGAPDRHQLTQELTQGHLLRASDWCQPKATESDELPAGFIGDLLCGGLGPRKYDSRQL